MKKKKIIRKMRKRERQRKQEKRSVNEQSVVVAQIENENN
jgi:hypothetical protein